MGTVLWLLLAVTLPSQKYERPVMEVHVTMSALDRQSCEEQRALSQQWAKQSHMDEHILFVCEEYNDLIGYWGRPENWGPHN
jgi:hypothetical protein